MQQSLRSLFARDEYFQPITEKYTVNAAETTDGWESFSSLCISTL